MEKDLERIQDYIDGQLDSGELAEFENRLAKDEELRRQLRMQQEISHVLAKRALSDEDKVRSTITNVSKEFRRKHVSNIVWLKRYATVASVACVLLLVGLFFLNRKTEVYTLPEIQSEIVRGQEQNRLYEDAVSAFNGGKYSEARAKLEDLLKENSTQIQNQYYLGLSYVGEKDWEHAISILKPISQGVSVFRNEAQYYLAVSYYKNGEKSKAVLLLDQLCNEIDEWCEKALDLKKKIK